MAAWVWSAWWDTKTPWLANGSLEGSQYASGDLCFCSDLAASAASLKSWWGIEIRPQVCAETVYPSMRSSRCKSVGRIMLGTITSASADLL